MNRRQRTSSGTPQGGAAWRFNAFKTAVNWSRPIARPLGLMVVFAFASALAGLMPPHPSGDLPDAPEVGAQNHVVDLTLRAVRDAAGHDQFQFNGQNIAPTIRLAPGDTLRITYINDLPKPSGERCSLGPCENMTNLHFHGLGVSPKAPQDDVLDMVASPGETLHYSVFIPLDQPPGLYWYHTHPHGESQQQVLDGMSGAIIVEGISSYVPEIRGLRERVLVVRGQSIEGRTDIAKLEERVSMAPVECGPKSDKPERIFTVNGAVRPAIFLAPGERQFWRIVNAASDRYLDLEIDRSIWKIVALTGYHLPTTIQRTLRVLRIMCCFLRLRAWRQS